MKKLFFLIVISLLSGAALSFAYSGEWEVEYSAKEGKFMIPFGRNYNYADILVTRVIDGDTLELESGERLRLIGIDTAEIHRSQKLLRDSRRTGQDVQTIRMLGERAKEFTRQLVEKKRVSLEFDITRYDRYNRLLAYVFLKDGTFVNARIIEAGYAQLLTVPPNVKYVDLFKKLYTEARLKKKGLWAD